MQERANIAVNASCARFYFKGFLPCVTWSGDMWLLSFKPCLLKRRNNTTYSQMIILRDVFLTALAALFSFQQFEVCYHNEMIFFLLRCCHNEKFLSKLQSKSHILGLSIGFWRVSPKVPPHRSFTWQEKCSEFSPLEFSTCFTILEDSEYSVNHQGFDCVPQTWGEQTKSFYHFLD